MTTLLIVNSVKLTTVAPLIPAVHLAGVRDSQCDNGLYETAGVRVAGMMITGSMDESHTGRLLGRYERRPV